jgi:hypothetical protein
MVVDAGAFAFAYVLRFSVLVCGEDGLVGAKTGGYDAARSREGYPKDAT